MRPHTVTLDALDRLKVLIKEHQDEIPAEALYFLVNSGIRQVTVHIGREAGDRKSRWALVDRLAEICGLEKPEASVYGGYIFYRATSPGWKFVTCDDVDATVSEKR